ncbi:ESPR-type extended signal peptide-containing protein [Veillonella parvula]|uniref:ESPR-type extended signal peptide-containing protein n=4 Tax=Veillonella TaxID=29465 RepID=UPI0035215FCF
MNRIYKVIWSRVKNCYVVVSEIANNRGKINGSTGTGVSTLLCALALVGSVAPPLNVAQAVNPAGTGAGVAWGNGAYSGTDQHNVALGGYAQASGTVALSLGAHSESTGAYSTAVGGGSHATAKNAAAIGPWSEARAENAVAVGATAKSLAEYAMAVGGDSMANAKNAVALGAIANASQENAVAIGSKAESSGEYAAAIGGGAKAKNKHAIAVGSLSEATGEGSFAVGNNSKAWNNYAYAIGGSSKATGQWSIAMGTNATAQEDSTVAIGTWAEATKGQATAIGNQARARAIGATSLGRLSLVSAVDGTAIGSSTSVTGLNGTAIGNKANVSVKNGVAIGNEANVANENAVAIGAGSETAAAVGTASEMINGEVHNFAGANPGSTVSVGKAGAERTITNVAAGRLSATSTDAVNGSQLYAVNTEVNKGVVYAGDVKAAGANDNKFTQRLGAQTNVVGGVADVSKLSDNNIGVVSNGSNTLNVKLAKELQGLTSVTTGNTVMNTDGVTITGGPKIVKDGIDAGNKQITNVASGGDVITNGANIGDINRIVTAKDKYVTGGTATYQANGDGTANLTGTNGLTANVTGLKNNFVTSGSVSNDGKTLTLERNDTGKVNVDLSNVFTEVAKGDYRLVANPEPNSQGKYKADSDGNMVLTVANDKGDKKQVTLTDIASKAQQDTNTTNITNINTTIAKGLNFKGDDATVINKQLGDQLDIKGGAAATNLSDNNIGVVSSNGSLNVKLAKDLTGLNSVTAGTARMGVDSTDHKSYVTGLDNRDWDVQNPVVVNGRAATEDQLKKVSDAITVANASKTDYRLVKNSAAADGSYTVTNNKVDLKVEDKANPTSPASTVTINNIASADDVEKLKSGFKVKAGNNEGPIKAGDTLEFAAKDNAIVEYDTAAKKLTVAVSKNPNFDSVTVGDVVINNSGINAGNKQITNVASGGDVITNGANIGDINRIVTAKDKYVTGGTATYQANGDGTANLTGTNGLTANVTGLKNNFVTSGSVSNDGKTLTLERNDTGKVNVDLSNVFTEVAKGDYRLVANPEPNSQGKYKADSDGNMVLTVANDKGDKKQVTLTDIASKAQQDTNTTNITNINTTIAKGLNFKGDDATVINKQLGDQLDIKGGAAATNLSDNNIGVVSSNGSLNVKLAKDLTGLNSVTAGTARMGVDSTDHKSYVTGLDNRDWDVQNPVVVNGRAATEDQLKKVSDAITVANASKTDYRLVKNSAAADGSYTVTNNKVDLKVEDKANPTSPASTVTINNIASADDVEKLKSGFKVKAGNNEGPIKAGDTLEFAAKDNAIVEYDTAAKKLTVAVSKNPNFDSVTVGDVVINNSGINAGNKQITNVASGGDVITNGANIGDINRIVTAKDKYVTGGTATYQANGDGTANLTGTNGLTANVTGLKNNFVTSGSVSNDGKTLTLERNDTGKVNVDLSNVFTEVAKGDYRLVANPEPNSQGKYKADSDGNMVLTVANDKGDKKQVTLTDIASKAQQDTNTTNITNINNTIAKGLNFAGDTGADINKQLGEKLSIKGGASADLTDNNIGVISDGAQLNVKLKKDVNLGPNGSLTINGKTYVNKDGLNAGGQKITNVAPGTDGTDAVNVDQLNAAIGGTSKATTVKAKDANVTVTEGVNAAGGKEYTVGLGDKVTLGSDADKKVVVDGTTGTITAGDKVTINGTTGDIKAGTVKITGAGTVNELTNRTWDIDNPTVVHGQAATEDQLKHVSDGVKNNKTDITNINNTIAKGLNFKGDDTTVINKQLGEQLDIKGGADANKLSDDNIGVVSANGALNVKLSKELKNLTSVTTGNTVMNTDGLTINGGPKIVKDGIDAGGKKITNVAAGTDNTDAVNFGQLKDVVAAGKTILKDGKNTTVEGDGSANNPYKVNVNDDLVLGKKGADGKDGSIGVNGKDGSAVVINGKDGSIGLNGKDGANGISIKGGDGKPGVDGTNITRLVIEEKNGEKHDVATLDDGMMYGGDTGAVIKKKLNGQVNVVGGITDVNKLTTDDNIGVVSDGANNLKARLAKDLKGLNSVTTGNTVMNTDGLTINGGPKIVKDGIDAGNKKITNVAAGTDNTDAVNFGQLKDVVAAGKTILKDGKNTTVEGDGSANNPYKVNVNDDLVLGKKGADGKDGSIGVNGKDGSAVVINGKDGSIGLNGKDGANGISIKGGDGKPGVDGTNITRLVIEEKNGEKHDVATLDDGMMYGGDTGAVIKKKLNGQVNVVGGITDVNKLTTDDNIGVVSDGANNLKARLAKDLKGLNSVTTGNTVMNTDGLTINGGPKIVKDGIDAGGKKITNVAAGTENTDAVNFGQLKDAIAAGKTILKDGKNTTVEGDGSANNPYKVNVNDDLVLGKKGADGKDGSIGVNGKDGSAVVINGKDGSIGLNGKDGANGISIKGGDGKPGVDGTNITRLVIEEKNGEKHDVATLDDGMKYGGDTGAVIKKKLNEQVNVVGGITDVNKLTTDDNIGVVSDGANNLKVRLAKDLKGLNSVTTGNTVMNSDGLTINGGPKIVKDGIDAGGKKITNVAEGTDGTDAVNVNQLSKAVAGATTKLENGKNTTVTSTTNNDGSKTYKVNLNDDITLGTDPDKQISIKGSEGTIQAGKVTVNGTGGTVNNLTNKTWDPAHITSGQAATEDQLKAVNDDFNNKVRAGRVFQGDQPGDSGKVVRGLGDTMNLTGGADVNRLADNNIGVVKNAAGDGYNIKLAKDLKGLESVTTTDAAGNTTVMNGNGITIKNNAGGSVSLTSSGLTRLLMWLQAKLAPLPLMLLMVPNLIVLQTA